MSSTGVIGLSQDGKIQEAIWIKNAWRGTMFVWKHVAQLLGFEFHAVFDDKAQWIIWNAWKDERHPLPVRVALLTTLDWALIRKSEIPEVVQLFREFAALGGNNSYGEQADALEQLARNDAVDYIGWQATTVSENMWVGTWDEATEAYAPFDFTSEKQFFVLDALRSPEVPE